MQHRKYDHDQLAHASHSVVKHAIFTVPNLISIGRFCCIPVFLWLLFSLDEPFRAALLLAVLGATDWIDGYIARRFDQISRFGKFFDPFADRVLLAVAAVALIAIDAVPLWFGIVALGREAIILVAGAWLATKGTIGLPVSLVGKTGAFALMLSFPLFLAATATDVAPSMYRTLAWLCGVVGIAFSWASLFGYRRLITQLRQSQK